MTVRQDGTGALIDDARQWHAIDWQRAQREVRRLQMRIAKAVKEGKPGRVKALQWLVTHSFYAKLLAVMGNHHAWFLGGNGAVRPLPYPAAL